MQGFIFRPAKAKFLPTSRRGLTLMPDGSIPPRSVPVAGKVSLPRSGWKPCNTADLVRGDDGPKSTTGTVGCLPSWLEAFRNPSSG
jgi:hypothetical protein